MFWEHNLYRASRFPSQIGSRDCRFTSKTSRSVSLIELLWILDFLNLTAKFVKISHKSGLSLQFWDFNSINLRFLKRVVITTFYPLSGNFCLNMFQNETSSNGKFMLLNKIWIGRTLSSLLLKIASWQLPRLSLQQRRLRANWMCIIWKDNHFASRNMKVTSVIIWETFDNH